MNTNWGMVLILLSVVPGAYAHGITDPTRPPWVGAQAGSTSHEGEGLRAILLNGPRRLALIDGKLLGVGGRVGRDHIVAIHHDAVILAGRGGERRLSLETRSLNIRKAIILKEGSR